MASSTDIARLAATAVSRPAVSAACRPTAAEPTSSSRPASSSALVCLITMKIVISAAKMAAQIPYRQVVSAPSEDPSSRPYRKPERGVAACRSPPAAARAGRGRIQLLQCVGRGWRPAAVIT